MTTGETGYPQIVAAARARRAVAGTIIAFADSRYLTVLMNWLVALAASGIDNYLVVALDAPLATFLEERGIPVVLSELRGDLGSLWVRRIEVFAALCAAGIDFVHSDVDAVWLRDPRAAYLEPTAADLVISQGTVWPPDVHQQFGFVLCCGLFRLKSNAHSQRLLAELALHVTGTRDDQVSLNRLIARRAPRWQLEPKDVYYQELQGQRFLCSRSVISASGSDGTGIALLPHHLFQRLPTASAERPYVLHPLTAKDPDAKLAQFAQCGCLLLRQDWRHVDFDAGSLLKLRAARPQAA